MNLAQFAALSQVLTGYGAETILPKNDTQHQAQEYLDTLYKPGLVAPETLLELTNTWIDISANPAGQWEQLVQSEMMDGPELGGVTRNIIYMWYLGIWYDLNQVSANDFVVSSKAYQNSLVWGTMGAHPMGYSEGNYGYWSTPPKMPADPTTPTA